MDRRTAWRARRTPKASRAGARQARVGVMRLRVKGLGYNHSVHDNTSNDDITIGYWVHNCARRRKGGRGLKMKRGTRSS